MADYEIRATADRKEIRWDGDFPRPFTARCADFFGAVQALILSIF